MNNNSWQPTQIINNKNNIKTLSLPTTTQIWPKHQSFKPYQHLTTFYQIYSNVEFSRAESPIATLLYPTWAASFYHTKLYILSNFEIRCDVIVYLRQVTIKRMCSIWNHSKHTF